MSTQLIPTRGEIPIKYTWNAESVFATLADWQAEYNAIVASLPQVAGYKGRLGESSRVLLEGFQAIEALVERAQRLRMYANMSYSVDTNNQQYAALQSQAQSLFARLLGDIAYLNPELLAIGEKKIYAWMKEEPALAIYEHYFHDLFRRQAHVRSEEVEEIFGALADPFSGPETVYSALTDADFRFPDAVASDGTHFPVTQGTLNGLLYNPDRQVRRTAWEGYLDTYLAYKNTLAGILAASIKQDVFRARARRHPSTLEAALFDNAIPVEVFHNLIAVFKKNLPVWHRYWQIRCKALGVDILHSYDVWAPLTGEQPAISFEQAVKWVCQGLAPLGDEYVETIRRGCLEQRWVDVFPNQGKSAGAFSYGSRGTYPFIVMSFSGTIFSLSTLAHELGHSMHSYLTWQNQPGVYSDYSLFVAEVASNFHQAMVRAYLLNSNPDAAFQIKVIEEAMSNFHRYFFVMPTLARFELEMHERVERGEGLTADDMIACLADLFAEGFGPAMHLDRARVGIEWATFGHLYSDYYVYQYATGISAANALSRRILSGVPGAAEDYLAFLKAGGSLYPLDALRLAGIDMTAPEPVEAAFEVLNGLVQRLDALLTAQQV